VDARANSSYKAGFLLSAVAFHDGEF